MNIMVYMASGGLGVALKVCKTEKLNGVLEIQGSKNAVLPIMAAAIINRKITRLKHVPKITDVFSTIDILEYIGCNVSWENDELIIDASGELSTEIPDKLVKRLRSSIIFLGALLARNGEAVITNPGGCAIGKRPIDIHLTAFTQMNIDIREEDSHICAKTTHIEPAQIQFRLPSVGATENIMLAAAGAKGITVIKNVALEPEISALADFLTLMGANVQTMGRTIVVEGMKECREVEYEIPGDRIVAATYMASVAGIGGEAVFEKVYSEEMLSTINHLRKMGCVITPYANAVRIVSQPYKMLSVPDFITSPYPGFPTDMMPQMTAVAAKSKGETKIVEKIFESRFGFTKELIKMGADITIDKPDTIIVKGVKRLQGVSVDAMDLRGGAALVIAALMAEDETIINHTEYIMRGYENICHDIQSLGGRITSI
ncbi:MAG: UDP-N-acetylglucosamine 1-carboxyvinyltransferase [Eubacterium sp.]